jgi:hypothetical protein
MMALFNALNNGAAVHSGDGNFADCLSITAQGARNLGDALLAAADEVDGWSAR